MPNKAILQKIADILRTIKTRSKRFAKQATNKAQAATQSPLAKAMYTQETTPIMLMTVPALWGFLSTPQPELHLIPLLLLMVLAMHATERTLAHRPENYASAAIPALVTLAISTTFGIATTTLILIWGIAVLFYHRLETTTAWPQALVGSLFGALPAIIGEMAGDQPDITIIPIALAGFSWAVAIHTIKTITPEDESAEQTTTIKEQTQFIAAKTRSKILKASYTATLFSLLVNGALLNAGVLYYSVILLSQQNLITAWHKHAPKYAKGEELGRTNLTNTAIWAGILIIFGCLIK